eukprot:9356097-Alexandrium_andersonii.AAC.1
MHCLVVGPPRAPARSASQRSRRRAVPRNCPRPGGRCPRCGSPPPSPPACQVRAASSARPLC